MTLRSCFSENPLYLAIFNCNLKATKDALKHVSVNHRIENLTPLMFAVFYGTLRHVEILLNHGADVHLSTENGHTALYFAVRQRNLNCVRLLIEHGADAKEKDKLGCALLQTIPISKNNEKLMILLLEAGAEISDSSLYYAKLLYHKIQCRRAAVALLVALKRHRKYVAKDIAKIIAKNVFSSRTEIEWNIVHDNQTVTWTQSLSGCPRVQRQLQ